MAHREVVPANEQFFSKQKVIFTQSTGRVYVLKKIIQYPDFSLKEIPLEENVEIAVFAFVALLFFSMFFTAISLVTKM